MFSGQNTAVSANLATLVDKAGAKIAQAIQSASHKTGVDFSYLLQQAQIESSFKADAKASSSSATGLYQFIDKTWLSMVEKYGDKYGIADTSSKKEILDLRKNPEICSLMAAEMASDNKDYLEKCTGQTAGATELYMAHFMGPAGAAKFLKAMNNNPDISASSLFPDAAKANKNIFFDKSGNARSLQGVYALFDKKFDTSCTVDNIASAVSPAGTNPAVTAQPASHSVEDDGTSNVLAALAAPATPLFTRTSSLFTTNVANDSGEFGNNSAASPIPHVSFLSMISPVDVLELMKTGYRDNNRG